MSETSSGPPNRLPGAAGRREPLSLRVGIPALLGTALGTLIGAVWRALLEPSWPAEDSLGLFYLAIVVGLPVLVAMSWVVLALTGPAWVAPAVTVAGLVAGSYAIGLYQTVASTSSAPPVALCALAWGASYAAVALACAPGMSRSVRGAVVTLLIAPVVLFLSL